MLSMADSVYADANLDRDGAELHIRHDSPIRHGEVERQEARCPRWGCRGAGPDPPRISAFHSAPVTARSVEYIHKDISTYIHLI